MVVYGVASATINSAQALIFVQQVPCVIELGLLLWGLPSGAWTTLWLLTIPWYK